MSSRLWKYFPVAPFKKIEDIDLWDQSDADITSFSLNKDRVLGEGSAKFIHANNSSIGVTFMPFAPTIDISAYTHMFIWGKTNDTSDVVFGFQSGFFTSDNYYVINSVKNINEINKWKHAKIDLSSPDIALGTFDPTNTELVGFYSSTPNHDFSFNFIVLAYELLEFETDILDVLQGIDTNISAINSNFPVLGSSGGITINEGATDEETSMPCFLKGETAYQKLFELKNIIRDGLPVILELENYGYYPIILDNITRNDISKETSPTSDQTMMDLTIQYHSYNND